MTNPTNPMQGKWSRELTDNEIRKLMSTVSNAKYVEDEYQQLTYIFFGHPNYSIIRAGALGGSTRDIHGGWKYDNPFGWAIDKEEIETMCKGIRVTRPN